MIELKQVTFQYENAPESVYSVHNVDLTIQNGECVVLCGRSGCGKTTITRLINGLNLQADWYNTVGLFSFSQNHQQIYLSLQYGKNTLDKSRLRK